MSYVITAILSGTCGAFIMALVAGGAERRIDAIVHRNALRVSRGGAQPVKHWSTIRKIGGDAA